MNFGEPDELYDIEGHIRNHLFGGCLSRKEALDVSQRMVELLTFRENKKKRRCPRRNPEIEPAARNAVKLMTNEEPSSSSSAGSPVKVRRQRLGVYDGCAALSNQPERV